MSLPPLPIPRGTVRLSARQVAAAVSALARPRGDEVAAFEADLARFLGCRHVVAAGSGKAAMVLLLRALDLPVGSGIAVADWNVPEVPSLVAGMGFVPRLCDIAPDTYGPDLEAVDRAGAAGARVLLATHLYGNPVDLDALGRIASRRGMILVEDACQAIGARYRGRRTGTIGRAGLFSFGLMKTLSAVQGGAVTTDDDDLAARLRALAAPLVPVSGAQVARELVLATAIRAGTSRGPFLAAFPALAAVEMAGPALVHGLVKMRPSAFEAGPTRPDPLLQAMHPAFAACGRAGIPAVDAETRTRVRHADALRASLEGLDPVACQQPTPGADPAWTNFVVRTPARDAVRRALLRRGIDSTAGYLVACHRVPGIGDGTGSFPNAEALARENLYLPVGPDLDDRDAAHVARAAADAVRNAARSRRSTT